jgi:hypothetical protein
MPNSEFALFGLFTSLTPDFPAGTPARAPTGERAESAGGRPRCYPLRVPTRLAAATDAPSDHPDR